MARANPLHIPELVEHCIGFLHPSDLESDLHACSLVNRSWVYAAQSRIFAEITLDSARYFSRTVDMTRRASRLLETLDASPHLIRFISALYIDMEAVKPQNFLRFCNLLYPCLNSLYIGSSSDLPSEASLAMKRLLSLPSLVSFDASFTFAHGDDFLQIWEACSPTIKHLSLQSPVGKIQTPASSDIGLPSRKRSNLESLKFTRLNDVQWWLDDSRFPFDFSSLKALSCGADTDEVFQGNTLAPALKTIEILTTSVLNRDISSFERLTELSVPIPGMDSRSTFYTIRTIPLQNRVRIRVIKFRLISSSRIHRLVEACRRIDREISVLRAQFPNLTVVHITVPTETPALTKGVEEYFPLWDPRISLQWNFRPSSMPPWHTRIA
ncbi:hypothetical protein C8R44DRAFT_886168 [Mycena epipterygia]|nr:hypothetical protein C8R44DRAFT_886168 [Mycena epipterygia]